MNLDKNLLRKALVSLSVEKVLRSIGTPTYEKVIAQLSTNYRCYLPDCYEHPEYLNKVLKKMFGDSYVTVVERIKTELECQMMEQPIEIFVTKISE